MIEFGLLPSFVTTRQINVLLRACHSRLIAPCTSRALCIFAQPCGRPGCLCQTVMKPNFFSSCGSLMILFRSDPVPVAITWMTVCISADCLTFQQETALCATILLTGRARPPGAPNAIRSQQTIHH